MIPLRSLRELLADVLLGIACHRCGRRFRGVGPRALHSQRCPR